jgi:hypothetical protein
MLSNGKNKIFQSGAICRWEFLTVTAILLTVSSAGGVGWNFDPEKERKGNIVR